MTTRIVQADRAVAPTENQLQHRPIHGVLLVDLMRSKTWFFSDFDSSDGILAEHTQIKAVIDRRNQQKYLM
jgi:hypothetical protein